MTGPEHLTEGKRLLAEAAGIGEATQAGQATATTAQGHLLAALVCATIAADLPGHTTWDKAASE